MRHDEEERERLLTKKRKACEDFLDSTLLLKKALERDEVDDVLRSLERRSELIRLINDLDASMSQGPQAGVRDEKRAMTGKLEKEDETLQERWQGIIAVNDECQTELSGKCEAMKKALSVIQDQERGVQGYAHQAGRTPKFLNFST